MEGSDTTLHYHEGILGGRHHHIVYAEPLSVMLLFTWGVSEAIDPAPPSEHLLDCWVTLA